MKERLTDSEGREPGPHDAEIDGLLRGDPLPGSSSPAAQAISAVLTSLVQPPSAAELADETVLVGAFSSAMARVERTRQPAAAVVRPADSRGGGQRGRNGFRVAVTAAAASLVLGGVAAAAVTGALPGPFGSGAPSATSGAGSAGGTVEASGAVTPQASASGSVSTRGGVPAPQPSGSVHGVPAAVTPTAYSVCQSVVAHTTPTASSGSGPVDMILAALRARAAARGLTLAQLCSSLLVPTPGPSGSPSGLIGGLPLPTLLPTPPVLPLPTVQISLPPITIPPLLPGGLGAG